MKNDEDALQCYRGPELMTSDYWVNIGEEWTFKEGPVKEIRKELMMAHCRKKERKKEKKRQLLAFRCSL